MKRPTAQTILLMLLFTGLVTTSRGQGGRREVPPKTERTASRSSRVPPPRKRKNQTANKRVSVVSVVASLTVNVNPPDAMLYLNSQQVEGPTILGLGPGQYLLTVRREGYHEEAQSINLTAGDNSLTITLNRLEGTLNVFPNVVDADINVKSVESGTDKSQRHYVSLIENLRLTPGDYQITISKEGHQSVTRKITLQTGGTVYLEPRLEPLLITKTQGESPESGTSGKEAIQRESPESGASGKEAIQRESPESGVIGKEIIASKMNNTKYEAAVPVKKVSPSYPMRARAARIKGAVLVLVEIDERGKVTSAKATEGPLLLQRPSEDAAKQWRFTAALENGIAVRSTQKLQFNFEADK